MYYNNATNVTETKCNIFGRVWSQNMESKQIQNYSVIWNYSSYYAGVFLYRRTKYSLHCTIGFLINTVPLCFILGYHLFFRKEYILFSNDYILVNTIFECCYLFFGWEIGHPLSRYDIEKITVPGRSNLCWRNERKIRYIYQRKNQISRK